MSKHDVEEDYLTEDPEISSQKVVLLSFLSPEKILANKDQYFFQKFLADYEVQWRTTRFEAWMAEKFGLLNKTLENLAGNLDKANQSDLAKTVRENLLRTDKFVDDFNEYVKKNTKEVTSTDIQTAYDDFLYKNSSKLEEEFFAKNEFRSTMRGIKVRGVFSSESEASVRAKKLQKSDPSFNIYMGTVGKWMAWEPDPNKVSDQEYANDELNALMKKYRENEEHRDQFYTEQKRNRVEAAKVSIKTESSMLNVTETTVENSVDNTSIESTPFGGAATGSYDGMFQGPADLAIARKQEKKDKDASLD